MSQRRFNAGYTIDQTILIVAIIGILVTMIIATVGMDLIAKTSGAKLASQLRQLEDAVGQFYAAHRQWPHQAATLTGNQGNQIAYTLTGNHPGLTGNTSLEQDAIKNYVTGFRVNGTAGTAGATLLHNFSGGDVDDIVRVYARSAPSTTGLNTANTYMIVEMVGVPLAEVLRADEIIDGDSSNTATRAQSGRIFFTESNASCITGGATAAFSTNDAKTVCYVANLVQ